MSDIDDVVERLRDFCNCVGGEGSCHGCRDAETIERLERKLAEAHAERDRHYAMHIPLSEALTMKMEAHAAGVREERLALTEIAKEYPYNGLAFVLIERARSEPGE